MIGGRVPLSSEVSASGPAPSLCELLSHGTSVTVRLE